ncbi:MAG: DUF4389 domain-containing protein [Dehalococcoidales bacterium]|nr:DUF4389 domain-containing protein [Dehalococcoidales bacterium]
MVENQNKYPASLKIDYPERPLNRLTTFFRLITVIPIGIILSLISGSVFEKTVNEAAYEITYEIGAAGGIIFFALLLMILFRQKYPKWWFDWNVALTKFMYRVSTYVALLRDEYPSTDEEQAVHIEIKYPDVKNELNSGMPLIKWFLAIPHYFILAFLIVAAIICVIIAWFAILFTGKYPEGLFNFVSGVMRWGLRVEAYAFLLITDRYPPFSLDAD